jgi:hypothetical protein
MHHWNESNKKFPKSYNFEIFSHAVHGDCEDLLQHLSKKLEDFLHAPQMLKKVLRGHPVNVVSWFMTSVLDEINFENHSWLLLTSCVVTTAKVGKISNLFSLPPTSARTWRVCYKVTQGKGQWDRIQWVSPAFNRDFCMKSHKNLLETWLTTTTAASSLHTVG